MTQVTLILSNGIEYNYLVWILSHFRPNIVLNLEFENFTDEDVASERFMELLGYYTINEVTQKLGILPDRSCQENKGKQYNHEVSTYRLSLIM